MQCIQWAFHSLEEKKVAIMSNIGKLLPEDVVGVVAEFSAPSSVWSLRATSSTLRTKIQHSCAEKWHPLLVIVGDRRVVTYKYFWGQHALLKCGECAVPQLASGGGNQMNHAAISDHPLVLRDIQLPNRDTTKADAFGTDRARPRDGTMSARREEPLADARIDLANLLRFILARAPDFFLRVVAKAHPVFVVQVQEIRRLGEAN